MFTIVPSYDRTDDLKVVLDELNLLDGEFDIHVYDDFSPHEKVRHLCAEFPRVQYHRSSLNLGVIGIRNLAMSELSPLYEYLFHFDDDSKPMRREHVVESVAYLDAHPEVALLAFPIIKPGQKYTHGEAFESFSYVGCGNAWRCSSMAEYGTFSPLFERQGEELEHSFRVWKSGYKIVNLANFPVVHWQSPTNRNRSKIYALNSTAYLKWTLINWSGIYLFTELGRWLIFTVRRTFCQRQSKSEPKGSAKCCHFGFMITSA